MSKLFLPSTVPSFAGKNIQAIFLNQCTVFQSLTDSLQAQVAFSEEVSFTCQKGD